jgi:ribosomal protein S18 acetylase RimI-like enzyme
VDIQPATPADLPAVRKAYAAGRVRQREQGASAWPEFPDAALRDEIAGGRLFVAREGETAAGVFSVAYEDPAIWGELESGAHIYLHRIARAPGWTGSGLVEAVLAWADVRCRELGRAGLRMDTWANNTALIGHYERFGFRRVAVRRVGADPRLLPHYHGLVLALLERPCQATAG